MLYRCEYINLRLAVKSDTVSTGLFFGNTVFVCPPSASIDTL
jgi:hypothetical protein